MVGAAVPAASSDGVRPRVQKLRCAYEVEEEIFVLFFGLHNVIVGRPLTNIRECLE